MPRSVLLDVSDDTWVDHLHAGGNGWSIRKRVLKGGRREGVEVVQLDNGDLSLEIVPTRGLGIRAGQYKGDHLGWDSPVTDGPVHPSLVNLAGLGGFGWLEAFDELLARCGLEHNGPPLPGNPFAHSLHGRIGNLPARRVVVEYPDGDSGLLAIEGDVDETRLFGPRLRLSTRIETATGSNRFRVTDRVTNLADSPAKLAMLYHWNWGPPYLEAGSRFAGPSKVVCPQTPRAAEGIGHFDVYGPPSPGFAEQVYLFEMLAGPDGRTLAMLRNRAGDKAIALRYRVDQLPCFTLWKNEGAAREGYVTGLEPATNYPNPRPFEQDRGRFVEIQAGATFTAETEVEIHNEAVGVAALEREIASIQATGERSILPGPAEPYAPGA